MPMYLSAQNIYIPEMIEAEPFCGSCNNGIEPIIIEIIELVFVIKRHDIISMRTSNLAYCRSYR